VTNHHHQQQQQQVISQFMAYPVFMGICPSFLWSTYVSSTDSTTLGVCVPIVLIEFSAHLSGEQYRSLGYSLRSFLLLLGQSIFVSTAAVA